MAKYIEEIREEVGGGGDILTEIHLRSGHVIYLAYGIMVLHTAEQWEDFQECSVDGRQEVDPSTIWCDDVG